MRTHPPVHTPPAIAVETEDLKAGGVTVRLREAVHLVGVPADFTPVFGPVVVHVVEGEEPWLRLAAAAALAAVPVDDFIPQLPEGLPGRSIRAFGVFRPVSGVQLGPANMAHIVQAIGATLVGRERPRLAALCTYFHT